ncbi:MAG: hypothetical protein K2J77_04070 [Oscillospiraceae bacterium]|nr:hypothetical protein [Oscillospiraceae bacterium]
MEKTKRLPSLLQSRGFSWALFAAYSLLTLLGALNHEVWLDEAQAWVILRDAPLSEIPHILKVEGHPYLWYIILYPFVKLGFPVDYVSLISWAFMAAGAWVLLFKVELPLPLKAVILFSSGFLFFNSVILRVYCLIPPILFLILWIYPKRREHAVLYGFLIALLTNTHVFICGIVAVLGIMMIRELFHEWKTASRKENVGKLIGLCVAGAGVLALVIPLLGSMQANGAVNHYNTEPLGAKIRNMLVFTPGEALIYSFFPANTNTPFWGVADFFAKVVFLLMLAALRHWRKAFAVELGFLAFYFITCGLIWTTLPNRAVIFTLSFAFALCLSQYETPVFKDYKITPKITGKIRALIERLIKADKKSKKLFTALLIVLFAITIPSGVSILYKDISGTFSGARQTARYIAENFEDDAVFVQLGDGMPDIVFYEPSIKIFSVDGCGLKTYADWEYRYRHKESIETTVNAISEYEHLYLISYESGLKDPIYRSDGLSQFDYHNVISIFEYNADAVESYMEGIIKLNEQKKNN